MSNPIKSIIKFGKKAFKSVAKVAKKVIKSPIGKAALIGAGVFFGAPALAGVLGGTGAAAGAANAGAWWSGTLGLGGASAGAGSGLTGSAVGTTFNTANTGLLGGAGGASAGQFGLSAAQQAGMAGVTGGLQAPGAAAAASQAATAGVTGAGTAQSGAGLLGRAWNGLGDFGKAAVINTAGQAVQGFAAGKAEEERGKEARRRHTIAGVNNFGQGDPINPYDRLRAMNARVLPLWQPTVPGQ